MSGLVEEVHLFAEGGSGCSTIRMGIAEHLHAAFSNRQPGTRDQLIAAAVRRDAPAVSPSSCGGSGPAFPVHP